MAKYLDYDGLIYYHSKIEGLLDGKVDKVTGKGLSTNDYTTAEKNKLAGIAAGAEVNVQSNWNETNTGSDAYILNKPTKLSQFTNDGDGTEDSAYATVEYVTTNGGKINTVKVNGTALPVTDKAVDVTVPTKLSQLTNDGNFVVDASYVHTDNNFTTAFKNKLNGIAAGAEVNVQSDWSVTDTTSDAYIKNKPTIPTVNNATLTIKRNSTSVGTFTANADQNVEIDINVPTNTNQLTNGAGFQNESQVNNLIANAIADITSFEYQIVPSLPATGEKGVIYLVSNSGTAPNIYDEYIWIASGSSGSFEKIGTTAVDLSGYWSKTELVAITNAEIDAVVA